MSDRDGSLGFQKFPHIWMRTAGVLDEVPFVPFKSLLHKMKLKNSQVINNLSKSSESPPHTYAGSPER